MYHLLTMQMAQAEHITEQLKAKDPMAWIGAMNNIATRVREIIYSEVIYKSFYQLINKHRHSKSRDHRDRGFYMLDFCLLILYYININ